MILNEQQKQAARSLNRNPAFLIIMEALNEELQASIKDLLLASGEALKWQQGRASSLKRVIDVIEATK